MQDKAQNTPNAGPAYDDLDYDQDDDDGLYGFDPADECMLGPDGQCGAAGSEWCDFECPYRDSEMFVGSAAWNAKHGVKP